jgi:peptidoglycan/xylan/chitin deacetylase (PgdA/CDA1 family)
MVRSAILTYHSLDDSGSVISTPPALFERQMEFLAGSGIPVVPLDQVLQHPGSLAISFDDGFCNFAERAAPVLERYQLPATVFVVSGYCGKMNNWPSQPGGGIPQLPLLSWADLGVLPALVSIGAHTATHPDLTRLPAEECEREMSECQNEIEQRLSRRAPWLAYPYGASSPLVRSLAGDRFELAAGTTLRFLSARSNRLDLPRIDTYYLRDWFPLKRLFTQSGYLYMGVRGLLRKVRRLAHR